MQSRESEGDEKAMMSKGKSRKKVCCFRCKKLGHFKRDCKVDLSESGDPPKGHKAKVSMDSSEDDDGALLANGSLVAKLNRGLWCYTPGDTG